MISFANASGLLTCFFLLTSFPAFADQDTSKPATVSVSGTGTAAAAPDMAILSVGVVREAPTAREALTANNEAMAAVLKSLGARGIEDKDLQTSGFSISPRYTYPKRKNNGEQPAPKITGYLVSNNLTVRIRELESLGVILEHPVSLGINTGGNIRFTNSDTKSLLRSARSSAVEDAIDKARTLVEAAGLELGEIVSINEGSHSPRPIPLAQARTLAVQEDASAVPIASGENEYRVTVNITWEIDQ